jgi:hypothetical protein
MDILIINGLEMILNIIGQCDVNHSMLKLVRINDIFSDNLRTLYIYRQRHTVIDVTLTYYVQNI